MDPQWNHSPPGRPAFGPETLHTSNYSLVLLIQLSLLSFDLFVNSFSELLRTEPAVQLVLFMYVKLFHCFSLTQPLAQGGEIILNLSALNLLKC